MGILLNGFNANTGYFQQPPREANGEDRGSARRRMIEQIRELKRTKESAQSASRTGGASDIFDSLSTRSARSGKETEDLLKLKFHYNFKELSGKISRAKNSNAAGQAVLAAKRKVQEMKRKLANADGDESKEIELALNHAKQMELAANKKKRNLEQEEMVTAVRKRDEQSADVEQSMEDMKASMAELWEDELSDARSELIKEQTGMFSEMAESLREQGAEMTDELMESMDSMIDEAFDEQEEMLAEMSALLEGVSAVNPHMSEEELEKLKTKHRLSEDKELLKADMDYLKEYVKLKEETAPSAQSAGAAAFSAPSSASVQAVFSSPAPACSPMVDVQL